MNIDPAPTPAPQPAIPIPVELWMLWVPGTPHSYQGAWLRSADDGPAYIVAFSETEAQLVADRMADCGEHCEPVRVKPAAEPERPAAIVEVLRNDTVVEQHLFDDMGEAERFTDAEPKGEERLLSPIRGWHYHPAAKAE